VKIALGEKPQVGKTTGEYCIGFEPRIAGMMVPPLLKLSREQGEWTRIGKPKERRFRNRRDSGALGKRHFLIRVN
jgi:hypothetical protein